MNLPTRPLKGASYALVLVALTQGTSLLDRQILAILAPAIKADLGIGDAEMGLLYGTVFALFYALFSLPLGRVADGWIRTKMLAICLVFWSAATAMAGLASSFSVLALSRLGVGIGEAAAQPAGTSLLYDYWPKQRRGFVMAIIASAVALGLGSSLILGGMSAEWWDQRYAGGAAPFGLSGWQFAFFMASLPGFVIAALMLLLKEPQRGVMDGIETPPDPHPFRAGWQVLASVVPVANWGNLHRMKADRATWRNNLLLLASIIVAMLALYAFTSRYSPRPDLEFGGISLSPHALQWGVAGFGLFALVNFMQNMRLSDPQAYRVITGSPTLIMAILVGSLQSVINYGMMSFNPSFLIRYYELSLTEAALQFGIVSASMGIVGPLIWGPLSDVLEKRFPGAGRAWIAMFAMVASPIMSFWVYYAATPTDFYILFAIYSIVLTGWMPPLYAIMFEQVLPRMRALTASLYLLSMTIIGMGVGPYAVGMMSDATGDLRTSMLAINCVAIPIAILLLAIVRRASRDEQAMLARAGMEAA